jgi:hypothetical protein
LYAPTAQNSSTAARPQAITEDDIVGKCRPQKKNAPAEKVWGVQFTALAGRG